MMWFLLWVTFRNEVKVIHVSHLPVKYFVKYKMNVMNLTCNEVKLSVKRDVKE